MNAFVLAPKKAHALTAFCDSIIGSEIGQRTVSQFIAAVWLTNLVDGSNS